MSAGHTPGPHSVKQSYHLGDQAWNVVASDGDNVAVGCLKADAMLFAAAPKLLALLIELIDIEGPQPGTATWANKVEAAIVKATTP